MPKTHGAKHLPGDRVIAMCWKIAPGTITTDDHATVTCKACLKAIAFNIECEAEWAARRAEFQKAFPPIEGGR